jgi:peptidyl-prolyl cis-trans isomerase A (cyclophilin A)
MRLTESKQKRGQLVLIAIAFVGVACRKNVDPPGEERSVPSPSTTAVPAVPSVQAESSGNVPAQTSSTAETSQISSSPAELSVAQRAQPGDPLNGVFTLADATKGLAPAGKLVAEIATDAGKLRCELFDDKAPKTVANFVGLARGLRPFKDPKTSDWVKRPGYDGTVFHRIIKGFMIQGGDPMGTGQGEPGYVFADEVWPGATHDRRGLLCMANRGPNTNGMQFFILDGPATHLDRSFTRFGSCGPDSVIAKLADSEVRGDRAVKPPKISKVTIRRGK